MQRTWDDLEIDPVAYARLSPEGRFLRVNKALCDLFGYPESLLLTLSARDVTHPEDRAQSVIVVDRAVRHREGLHQVTKRYLNSQGQVFWALLSTTLERDEGHDPVSFLSRIENISERVDGDPVIGAFIRRMQTIKEQERQSIATELHEGLGQNLAGIKLELDTIGHLLPPESHAHATRLSAVVDGTLDNIRRFTAALRPPILDDLGLESAIEWMLVKFCGRANVDWEFHPTKRPLPLDWETRIALFRIAQEGIYYIIRHSEATRVEVTLDFDGEAIVLGLADNGVGPSDATPLESKGLELFLMRERAEMLGGSVTIRANSPRGTVVETRMRVPLQASKGDELKSHWQ